MQAVKLCSNKFLTWGPDNAGCLYNHRIMLVVSFQMIQDSRFLHSSGDMTGTKFLHGQVWNRPMDIIH